MQQRSVRWAWGLLVVGLAGPIAAQSLAPERRAQIESDWLLQDYLKEIQRTALNTAEDARGACDGVKNGRWGFHTNYEDRPWWQVDLGSVQPLTRVVVYNRCDAADRVVGFLLLLSDDGQNWREVYRHPGPVFYGATDGRPLEVPLQGATARFVRLQLPQAGYLHLDEVEIYGTADESKNLALGCLADQSSLSQWSTRKLAPHAAPAYPLEEVLARGEWLLADLRSLGARVDAEAEALQAAGAAWSAQSPGASMEERCAVYLQARWAVRRLALANPLLDFDRLLFVKRAPGSFSHMSDQNYGWWSRPGGGIYLLEGFKDEAPRLRCLTETFPEGSFLSPDLSYDGSRLVFAWCRYYPQVAGLPDKRNKANVPEDAFYHLFEMNLDGSSLRQLTSGHYDDFDARYLPNGEIVFLSTRRGTPLQAGLASAMSTLTALLPDSYVRCGGDAYRPVAVYTLHVLDPARGILRAISPFENFEWTPSVADDGRILYARWDYVDRDNMPYMGLWSCSPDGDNPQCVYGNFTRNPHCVFEARSVPGSHKILFTASAHHSITGGSLVLLDPDRGFDGPEAITRLTPEVCFPEAEGWPQSYYCSPYPLSERYWLVAWSPVALNSQGGLNPPNALGLYLGDAFGNLELLYRDPEISSMSPLPVRPRPLPHAVSRRVAWEGAQEGRLLLLDVYEGLSGVARGVVKRLRIVGVPAKTQPDMNTPNLGVTRDDPGKFVLGSVPVEEDGSAYFRVPSGVPLFLQALDEEGIAIQTMRTVTYVQPGQTLSCTGCHEPRNLGPPNRRTLAAGRPPSLITPGPPGSWPLRYDDLVQPVLDRACVGCHRSDGPDPAAAQLDLTPGRSYAALIAYGSPSLQDHVLTRYREGRSPAGAGAAATSPLLRLLRAGHHDVRLEPDSLERLITWMDTYAQQRGAFSAEQEADLRRLRVEWAGLMAGR